MTVGIALSGGALRGIFHLGVLQAMDEENLPISALAGTSSGSIVAVLYACGLAPKEILKIASSSSLLKMFRLKPWAGGILSHSYLESLLKEHLTVDNLEDLYLPVAVTAVNIRTGLLETFERGPIIPVVSASSSIPIMFNPVKYEGESYLDGGLLMNLPCAPLEDKVDKIIGVNLIPEVELPKGQLTNFLKIAERTFDLAVLNNIRPQLAKADVVVTMDALQSVGRMSWSGMSKVFDLGYEAAGAQMEAIKELY